ncbi:hypothetical protein D3C73_418860 [compost metagenome]
MRTTAEIKELALIINGDNAVFRKITNQFQLVRIFELRKNIKSFLTAYFAAGNRQILANDALHLLLNLLQIFRIKRVFKIHIVIEAVLNYRSNAEFYFLIAK